MADHSVKLIRAFELAKRVNHYYWEHVADPSKNMRVENVQRIIEWMTKLPINKFEVPFFGQFIRGVFERYADRIDIYIRAGQSVEWIRFTIVKELCHALIDEAADYSPKGEETIQGLIKFAGLNLDDLSSGVLVSERLAEIVALELIYPLELRDEDIAKQSSVADIVKNRLVPSPWVQRALDPGYISTCKFLWKHLATETPPPLEPLVKPPSPGEVLIELAIDAAAVAAVANAKKPEQSA